MVFNFPAFSVTAGLVVVSGAISFLEGTLISGKVKMGFLNHGGMWGDLVLLSAATGVAFPYFTKDWILIAAASFLALAMTILAHVQWAKWMRDDGVTGHIFPRHNTGEWYRDMSVSGWIHVLIMTILLTGVFMYVVYPMPTSAVVTVSLLISVHTFLATVQPGWYCGGKLWTWRNFLPPLLTTALIWSIAAIKTQVAHGGR